MKKVLTIALTAMMALSLAACTSTAAPTATPTATTLTPVTTATATILTGQAHVDAIKKAGKLTIITSADYPPYEFIDSSTSKPVGVDMDIAQAIADKLGVKLEIKNIQDFDGVLASLQAGYQDIAISGVTPDDGRRKTMDFSDSYSTTKTVIVVKKGNENKYKTVADLAKVVVGAQRGSEQEDVANDFIKAKTVKTQTRIDTLLLSLSNGQIDAAVVEEPVAKAYLTKMTGLVIANMNLGYAENGYCVVFNKNDDVLKALVNETIKELKSSGKIDTFYKNAADKMNAAK